MRPPPIHEHFHTFQGEGTHAGRSAYFIRTFGCPVHCPWCDSAGTWHPDYVPEQVPRPAPGELARRAAASGAEFTVITGGEPAIHDLSALTAALRAEGQPRHLETSGAFPLRGEFDWITLSPKRWHPPLAENLEAASEYKVVVDAPEAIAEYARMLRERRANRGGQLRDIPFWLQPEWSLRDAAPVLRAITDWVKANGAPFRAGWQLHKPYAADRLDAGSAPAAPLGGDPAKGF